MTYNAGNHSVTVTVKKKLQPRQSYMLVINGTAPDGLKQSSGSFLGGQGLLRFTGKGPVAAR